MHITLALLLFSGSPAQAPRTDPVGPAAAAAPVAPIGVDLSQLEPLDPMMRTELVRLLQTRAAAVVGRHAVPPGKVRIAIGWHDVDLVDYSVAIELDAHDGETPRSDRRATGPDTEQSELADVVEAALERMLIDWTRAHAAAASKPDAVPSHRIVRPLPSPPALGPVGWVGVGTGIAGVCSVGVGIGLLTMEPTPDPNDETKLRTWQPGGIAFTAVGGAAMVTGVVLASLDGHRRARQRRVAVMPWARRRGAGLSLGFRF